MTAPLIVTSSDATDANSHPLRRGQTLSLELEHDRSMPYYWAFEDNVPAPKVSVMKRLMPPIREDGVTASGGAMQTNHYTWDAAALSAQPKSFSITAQVRSPRGAHEKLIFNFTFVED